MQEFKPFKEGKVREVYDNGDSLIMVATDRISALLTLSAVAVSIMLPGADSFRLIVMFILRSALLPVRSFSNAWSLLR